MIDITTRLMRDATFRRFIVVGIVNTLFGYAVYAVLVLLGLSPQPALALSFVVGVLWNYWIHARLVFNQRGLRRLPAYCGCYVAIYLLNAVALMLALQAGMHKLVAQALLAPFAAVLSFFIISRVLTGRFPLAPGAED